MIRKCKYFSEGRRIADPNLDSSEGINYFVNKYKITKPMAAEIVGVNIKPMETGNPKVSFTKKKKPSWSREKVDVTKWGFFVHIKASDGYQYDAIFDIENTALFGPFNTPFPIKRKRKSMGKAVPAIMHNFGATDMMGMIGTKLKIAVVYNEVDGKKKAKGLQISCKVPGLKNDLVSFVPYFDFKKYDGR